MLQKQEIVHTPETQFCVSKVDKNNFQAMTRQALAVPSFLDKRIRKNNYSEQLNISNRPEKLPYR